MTLGDVLPALQQGTIDGAIAGITVFSAFRYQDAAKYVTEVNQPSIFLMLEVSKTWYDSLPPDLQKIVDKDAAEETVAINPAAIDLFNKAREAWTANGGELISLSPADQAKLMETISSVGEDVSRPKPALHDAYRIVAEAAKRTARSQPNDPRSRSMPRHFISAITVCERYQRLGSARSDQSPAFAGSLRSPVRRRRYF